MKQGPVARQAEALPLSHGPSSHYVVLFTEDKGLTQCTLFRFFFLSLYFGLCPLLFLVLLKTHSSHAIILNQNVILPSCFYVQASFLKGLIKRRDFFLQYKNLGQKSKFLPAGLGSERSHWLSIII